MKIRSSLLLAIIVWSSTASTQTLIPTWSDNIACILYTRCVGCHNPNGIAPFSLMTYQDAYNNAYSMAHAVNDGEMPPWPPDQNFQRYAYERTISAEERNLISIWVGKGIRMGDIANAPDPPVFSSNSELPQIDLTLQIPVYTNPATKDDYRCFVIPLNLVEDMFITSWEVIPGNRNMVHHVLVFQDTTGTPVSLDNADPAPGYTSFGGIGSQSAQLIGGWVPGSRVSVFPDGMGIKLRKNANIVMQMHYPEGTTGEQDSTLINFVLSNNQTLRQVRLAPILNHSTSLIDGPLVIPADSVKTFHAEFTLPNVADVTLLSAAPHMHLIGKSIVSYAVTPSNDTINFIKINNWDFHWQGGYSFRQPLKIPAGSTLYAEATYDNTTNNPENPSSPPQTVSLGESTTDEMMLVYFAFLVYQNGDENIIIDTSTAISTYNDCNYKLATEVNDLSLLENRVRIFPNLVEDLMTIENFQSETLKAEVYDLSGKQLFKKSSIPNGLSEVDLSALKAGMYFVRLSANEGQAVHTRRVIKM